MLDIPLLFILHFPIMLALCLILSMIHYAQNYAGIRPPAYYAKNITYYAFEQCSKQLSIMLSIMP